MSVSKFLVCLLHLISITNIVQSQTTCLNNTVITCFCTSGGGSVTCLENLPSNETFIDWSTFSSVVHDRASFNFVNFTRLTPQTFTNFSSTFHSLTKIEFNFRYGIEEIAENTFQPLNYHSYSQIHLTFYLSGKFQLADYAFSQLKYDEITITNPQNLPYQFNLKAFDNTTITRFNIQGLNEMYLISNQSSLLRWSEVKFTNCSLTNVDLLIQSLSSEILTTLNLSFNNLLRLPSLIKFHQIISIELQNNLMEEIHANIFTNLSRVFRIDLSHNRIKHISPEAFIGMKALTILVLENNHLTSLETVNTHNQLTSFLYPLNQSLHSLYLSNNLLHDFSPLKNLSLLNTLVLCCNRIKQLDEYAFGKKHKFESIDLSSNHIESIHPLAFNGASVKVLDLSSNLFSSLETTKITYDEHFRPKNQTTSFLDSEVSRLTELSLKNCTNLLEINWFVLTKLNSLLKLDLSGIPKTDKFWTFQPRDEDASVVTSLDDDVSDLSITFNGIQFENDDYCLSQSIFHIFNRTRLFLDLNHPCNCFVFMLKPRLDSKLYPTCLSNASVVDELTQDCRNIDSFCSSLTTTTSTTSTQSASTSSSSSSSASSSTLTSTLTTMSSTTTSGQSSSTSFSTLTSTTTTTLATMSSTTPSEPSSTSSSTAKSTTTNALSTLGAKKDDGKWKTTLAVMIPLTIIVIALSLAGVYIIKKRQMKNARENIEMEGGFVNPFAKK